MSDKHPIKQRQALDVYICLAYIALLSLPSCSRLLYSCTIMVKLIYFHTYLSLSVSLSLSLSLPIWYLMQIVVCGFCHLSMVVLRQLNNGGESTSLLS